MFGIYWTSQLRWVPLMTPLWHPVLLFYIILSPPGFSGPLWFFSFFGGFSFSPCPLIVGVPSIWPSTLLFCLNRPSGWSLPFSWVEVLKTLSSLTPSHTCTPDSRLTPWAPGCPLLDVHLLLLSSLLLLVRCSTSFQPLSIQSPILDLVLIHDVSSPFPILP